MSNISNAQINGKIIKPFNYIEEQNASLTEETLSIVGTSSMGPAFVPQQVLSFEKSSETLNTWENIFGEFEYQKSQIGPIAANVWLSNNGNQLTYTRVLGIGNGEGLNNDNSYVDAGFVVGDRPLSGSINEVQKGPNKYSVQGGAKGRTHFFGSYFKELNLEDDISPYRDYIEQITGDDSLETIGLITDVVFASDGAVFHLQEEDLSSLRQEEVLQSLGSTNSSTPIDFGAKESSLKNPKIYVQGIADNSQNILDYYDESNKYLKTNYFENNLNIDEDFYLNTGNLKYASFRNTTPFENTKRNEGDIRHFVAVGTNNWNEEGEQAINYESFESIYTKAKTPWIVSQAVFKEDNFRQNLQNCCKKLFRLHTYSDGVKGNNYRFRIKPRRLGDVNKTDMKEKWSVFDLIVYKFNYKENKFSEVLSFIDLNLNPRSENYICKKIGTEREYYNLENKKVCHEGTYRKTNNHVYVEVDKDVEYMTNESDLIPSGFFPYPHINISNSSLDITDETRIIHNPIQYVANMRINDVNNNVINYDIDNSSWGVEFNKNKIVKLKKISLANSSSTHNFSFAKFKEDLSTECNFYYDYTKYFQNFKTNKFWITPLEDTDTDTHNDFFHLEKILYLPAEATIKEKWNYAFYRRDGKSVDQINSIPNVFEYIDLQTILKSETEGDAISSVYCSFDLFTYGGFDGINILDENKRKMNNASCLREYEGEITNQKSGQTTNLYRVAKDIATDTDNFRCDLFSIPGINTPEIVKDTVNFSKEKMSFVYLFDVIDYDSDGSGSIIKNNYYYNNTNNNIKDILDEDDTVKTEIINGSTNSLDNHFLNYYDTYYSLSTYNLCEAVVDDKRLVAPSSLVFINSLSQTNKLSDPVDSIDYTNNIISFVNPINSKFIYNNNDFDKLLLKTKEKLYSINPIGVLSAGKKIKPLSANTLSSNRKNSFSLFHNVRVYLDIKRKLKNLLIVEPTIANQSVLFSPISETNVFSNIKPQVELAIIGLLEEYKSSGEIKDYFVNLSIADFNKTKLEKYENRLSGTVSISLFGDNSSEDYIKRIQINSLLNDISDFTQNNNISIININN